MSAEILTFTPRAELQPVENLEAFIALCRRSKVLKANEQFDLDVWDAPYLKGQNKAVRVIFSTREAASTDARTPALPPPFLDFAKATLVYLEDKRPLASQAVRLSAFRYLEAALRESGKGSRPTAVNEQVLNAAVALARNDLSAGVAYRVAGQLQLLSELLNSKNFISLRQPWHHGLKKPAEQNSKIDKEAVEARQKKLPTEATVRALTGIFHQAIEPPDLMVSSYCALMLCAPERINETLRLQRNCLVEGDGRHHGSLGLRWSGSKGADDTTKWLPTDMAVVARKAIANLLHVSKPAREIAQWYSSNPRKLFFHSGAEHLRGKQLLTPAEVAELLWGSKEKRTAANVWANSAGLEKIPLGGQAIAYRFVDVETAVIGKLPSTFPYVPGDTGLLCANAIALMRLNENHRDKATYLCMFECIDHGIVTNALGREDRDSIFTRFGYTEDDGSPIKMNSHSLRHFLNTIAQRGGLSSAEIAIFSGRKDQSQNSVYDHMTIEQIQAPIRRALDAGFTGGLVASSIRSLHKRGELNVKGLGAVHITDFGFCRHNFASEPCQMYRDCINCEEQVCVKGDAQKHANLRLLKNETDQLLKSARGAMSEGEYGADQWVKHQTLTLSRVNEMLSIFEDASVPQGSLITLNVENAALVTLPGVAPNVTRFQRRVRVK